MTYIDIQLSFRIHDDPCRFGSATFACGAQCYPCPVARRNVHHYSTVQSYFFTMLLLFNKPYRVLSQFTDGGRDTLKKFVTVPDVYAAGRLDYESEGLLLLTDDGDLQARIADPRHGLPKTYYAQVEGTPNSTAIERLKMGVTLKDGRTRPVDATIIATSPDLWDRDPPIRHRKNIPTTWLEIVLREGRNRQVRRMTAEVGHPTLRLVRWAVGPWDLTDLPGGEWREVPSGDVEALLPKRLSRFRRQR